MEMLYRKKIGKDGRLTRELMIIDKEPKKENEF